MSTTTPVATAAAHRHLLSHWPSALGLAIATLQIVTGFDTQSVAATIAVAQSCYLAGAAFGKRWVAWLVVPVLPVVTGVGAIIDLRWWAGLAGYATVLVVIGLIRRSSLNALTAQTLAMVGFGGVAVAALTFSPRLGLGLAGLALAVHALWDFRHWRRNDVVSRSLAEFCIVLDVLFGGAAMLLAVTG